MVLTKKRDNFKLRTRVILGAVLVAALLLVVRLYFLQIIHGSQYRDEASDQYVSTSGGFYDRGSIFFVDKDNLQVRGATIKTGYILALKPAEVVDPEALYALLAPYTTVSKETFMARATKAGDPYEEIAVHVSDADAAVIKASDLDGILLIP